MHRMASLSGFTQRRHGRAKLQLPCRVHTSEFEMPATVIDLSYGGAGIAMPPVLAAFSTGKVRQISIEGLGTFDVVFRWKTSDRMGVSFRSAASARKRVGAYFHEHGIAPQPD